MAPVSNKCQWCSAINCSNSRKKRPDLSFFRFPKDKERAKEWVINCRRADLDNKPAEALYKSNVLCEEHFEPPCFSKTALCNKQLLKKAVPTIFNVPNPPPQKTPSRAPPKQREPLTETKVGAINVSPSYYADENVSPTTGNVDDAGKVATLKRKLNAMRSRTWRLRHAHANQQKGDNSSKSDCATTAADMDKLRSMLSEYMSPAALELVLTQVRVSKLSVKGRRWTHRDKSLALSIYHASRKAYRLLQRLFKMPSAHTLTKVMKNVHIKPGVCANMLHLFEVKVASMNMQEKACVILLDEMALKASLKYNPLDDEVEGFEDFGQFGRSPKHATHALVFMVRGLSTKWKQPVSYYLSNGPVKAHMLVPLLFEVIRSVTAIGLVPKIVVCDQGSNNRAMCSRLHITEDEPYFYCDNSKIFFMYDPPHLLKSIRNNLKLHGFVVNDTPVSWDHVVQFYELDCKSPIRMAPKLTSKHMTMPPFSHLRVCLAAQVLSHGVAAGISAMVTLKALPPEAIIETAKFAEQFDRLFNSFNSSGLRSKNVMGHGITASSTHTAFLEQCLEWLKQIKCRNTTQSLPCLEGWRLSISCLLQLWRDLREHFGFRFLLTDRLNQDCLENLFAVIRSKGGNRFNPDSSEFKAALRQCMVDSVMTMSERQNCKEDVDSFLFSLENIASKGSNRSIRNRLQQDVPRSIQPLMMPSATTSLTSVESNIIVYIAGYVASKLVSKVCTGCKEVMVGVKDFASTTQVFLQAKSFEECRHGGLQVPSEALVEGLSVMEETFRSVAPLPLQTKGLRSMIIKRLMLHDHPSSNQLVCPNSKCDLLFYITNLFTNIRLHHHIKLKNRELTTASKGTKRNRKAATFQHQ